jgi:hypothetical protein
MLCSISTEDDGQLHTLGLLERLRKETGLVQGQYSDLYRRVDSLLREIENPNLHDIGTSTHCISAGLSPPRDLCSWRAPPSMKQSSNGRIRSSRSGKGLCSSMSIRRQTGTRVKKVRYKERA